MFQQKADVKKQSYLRAVPGWLRAVPGLLLLKPSFCAIACALSRVFNVTASFCICVNSA
jgi:hypothetical protein